jgi:hypothetical protein
VPESVQAVVTRLLQREPDKRFADARAVVTALRS